MSNKLGKIIGLASLAGAAAAGIYYFLLKDDAQKAESDDDDVKKFFSEDVAQSREYVSLNKKVEGTDCDACEEKDCDACDAKEEPSTKEVIQAKIDEAAKEAAEKEAEIKDGVGVLKDADSKAEEFEFEELETEED